MLGTISGTIATPSPSKQKNEYDEEDWERDTIIQIKDDTPQPKEKVKLKPPDSDQLAMEWWRLNQKAKAKMEANWVITQAQIE